MQNKEWFVFTTCNWFNIDLLLVYIYNFINAIISFLISLKLIEILTSVMIIIYWFITDKKMYS